MTVPAIPKIKLGVIEARVKAVLGAIMQGTPEPWDYARCQRLALSLHYIIDERDVPTGHIFQTLVQYCGRPVDLRWAAVLAWQLVARSFELKLGALQPYENPIRDEWVPMEIYGATPAPWREDKRGQLLTLHCLAGSPAGHRLRKKFPEDWLAFLAYRIGYNRRIQYDHEPKDLLGFRFWGYLKVPKTGATDELDFEDWQVDKQTKTHNVAILRLRKRFELDLEKVSEDNIEQYSCPFGYDHYCSSCHRTAASCIAAPNRERVDVGRPLVDGTPTGDPEPS
jgi:hypothetical protein